MRKPGLEALMGMADETARALVRMDARRLALACCRFAG